MSKYSTNEKSKVVKALNQDFLNSVVKPEAQTAKAKPKKKKK